jgi:hypothetical protein
MGPKINHEKPPPPVQTPTPQDAGGAFSDELAQLAKRKGFAANLLTGQGGQGLGGQLAGGPPRPPAVSAGVNRLLGIG